MQFLWKYSAEVVIKKLSGFTEWKSMNNDGVDCERLAIRDGYQIRQLN